MAQNDNNLDTVTLLVRAADYAAVQHRRQLRKDNVTPYIVHPLGVARILTEEGNITDPATIAAAMLHDTVEDTDSTIPDIERLFGKEIAGIVDEVSDDKTLSDVDRKAAQVVSAPHKSPKAKLVKLADKLYNLRDINRAAPIGWDEDRCQRYFVWASQVCAGLVGSNADLEAELIKLFEARNVDVTAMKKK